MILTNIAIAFPLMLLCLAIQAVASFWGVRYYVRQYSAAPRQRTLLAGIRPLLIAMLVMLTGNFVQITVWGVLFVGLGEFSELYEAIYHSAVNFASLGYGDIVMSKTWKLLGPLEAVNGVLMLGMTAAAVMVMLQHLIKVQREFLRDSDREAG